MRRLFRGLSRALDRRGLESLIFFVNSTCNFRCRTCFYWEQLNDREELTLEEVEKICRSLPPFDELLISGGEPLLRQDLVPLVRLFQEHNRIRRVYLPTNGWFVDKTLWVARAILEARPGFELIMNLHLDGFEATHDRIVGVAGSYKRVIALAEELARLRRAFPSLRVNAVTVICNQNLTELWPFAQFLFSHFDLDMHFFQLARGSTPEGDVKVREKHALAPFFEDYRPLIGRYLERERRRSGAIRGIRERLWSAYRQGFYQLAFEDFIFTGERWPFPCLAGRTIAVLEHNGDFRACELRDKMGNVREFDYNLALALKADPMQEELEAIRQSRCSCTHLCFIYSSLVHDLRAYAYRAPLKALWRSYLRDGAEAGTRT